MTIKVLYTGAFRFPKGDAAAKRVAMVAKLLEENRCHVTFAGWEASQTPFQEYRYQDRPCFSMNELDQKVSTPVRKLIGYLKQGGKTLSWLKTRPHTFDAVIAYNPPALFANRLRQLGKMKGFCTILDNTEWYDNSHLPGGTFGPVALENMARMQMAYRRFDDVICISKFLEARYNNRNVINIPPLTEVLAAVPDPHSHTGPVSILYAGNLGRKDKLDSFIKALPRIQMRVGRPVRLRIAGMEHAALISVLDKSADITAALSHVECLGSLTPDSVKAEYLSCHFSVIVREDKRYAWAGFPTKVPESLGYACPVIANRVGDIGNMLTDGHDAILACEDTFMDRLPDAIARALEPGQHKAMRTAALDTAGRHFTTQAHIADMRRFLERAGFASRLSKDIHR